MKQTIAALFSGALFGLGLALAQMTNPNVILGFLDIFGAFDPTLLFVLGGAVATSIVLFWLILRRHKPLFAPQFYLPLSNTIDRPLIIGATLFGIGWGLSGFCPGPALVAVAGGIESAWLFVLAMVAGNFSHKLFTRANNKP